MASNTSLHSSEGLFGSRGEKYIPTPRKTALLAIFNYRNVPLLISTMKKYICVLASAALLAACEQKTETTQPATTPAPTAGPEAAAAAAAADRNPAARSESPAAATPTGTPPPSS